MSFVVVEFPAEIRYPDGRPSGSRRGWFSADDPALWDALSRPGVRLVAHAPTADEARALCKTEAEEVYDVQVDVLL